MELKEMLDKLVMDYNLGKFESLSLTGTTRGAYTNKRTRMLEKVKKIVKESGYTESDIREMIGCYDNEPSIEYNNFENVYIDGDNKVCTVCGELKLNESFAKGASYCRECRSFYGWVDRFLSDKTQLAEFRNNVGDSADTGDANVSYIYFYKVTIEGLELIKIGKAKNPHKRIEQVEKSYEQETGKIIKHELVSVIKHSEENFFGRECVKMEKALHRLYVDHKVELKKFDGSTEYFSITEDDVVEIHKFMNKKILKEVK